MNLAFRDLPADEFRYNLKFLDKKRNIIMDGDFVKIAYSDEHMAINTIFFITTLKLKSPLDENRSGLSLQESPTCSKRAFMEGYGEDYMMIEKYTIWFSPYESKNQQYIQSLLEYEAVLIDEYRKQTGCTKEPLYFLKNQLLSGNLRVYRFHARHQANPPCPPVIKIAKAIPDQKTFQGFCPGKILTKNHQESTRAGVCREPGIPASANREGMREPVVQTSHGLQCLASSKSVLQILVKISGIWESNDSFGITYKFIDYEAV